MQNTLATMTMHAHVSKIITAGSTVALFSRTSVGFTKNVSASRTLHVVLITLVRCHVQLVQELLFKVSARPAVMRVAITQAVHTTDVIPNFGDVLHHQSSFLQNNRVQPVRL